MAADSIEHRILREWQSDSAALTDAVEALQTKGARWLRARFGDMHLIVEGWRDRPGGPRRRRSETAGAGCG